MTNDKNVYRYFSRKTVPSAIPPFGEIYMVVDCEKPIDSGNGKKMYGYVDYYNALPKDVAEQFGLEYAPINPILVRAN